MIDFDLGNGRRTFFSDPTNLKPGSGQYTASR